MQTITLPTTLHCASCVTNIKPFFDAAANIKTWQVDLSKPIKTITVTGENVTRNEVVNLLRKADYDVAEQGSIKSSALPETTSAATGISFWRDNTKWQRASLNTLTCLAGCSLGDFMGFRRRDRRSVG